MSPKHSIPEALTLPSSFRVRIISDISLEFARPKIVDDPRGNILAHTMHVSNCQGQLDRQLVHLYSHINIYTMNLYTQLRRRLLWEFAQNTNFRGFYYFYKLTL